MLPVAEVSHCGAARLRLRLRARRGDTEFFKSAVATLAALPGVTRVTANPVSGSLMIEPGVDPGALAGTGLFEIAAADATARPLTESLAQALLTGNTELKRVTGGHLDFASVALVALVGGAVMQAQKGHLLGPAATLLWYASGLLLATEVVRRTRSAASSPRHDQAARSPRR